MNTHTNIFNYIKIIRPASAHQRLQLQAFLHRKPLHDGQILVIENIEHASDLTTLKNIQGLPSKHYFQGYWFSKPLSLKAFVYLLSQQEPSGYAIKAEG